MVLNLLETYHSEINAKAMIIKKASRHLTPLAKIAASLGLFLA